MPRRFTTPVELPGPPTEALHAATKAYVDWAAAPVTFVDTAVAYTAKPGEYVLVDASGGPVTITLSTGTSGVKKVDLSANVVTVQAAAGNTLGSLGATAFPLRLPDQALVATVRGTNHAITHGYQSLQQLDTRFARTVSVPGSVRSVSASTTVVVGEALWVDATGAGRVVTLPAGAAAGNRVEIGHAGGTNTVTITGPVSGDPDGVRLSSPGTVVTLLFDGSAWWVESVSSALPAQVSGRLSSAPTAAGPRAGAYSAQRNVYVPNAAALRRLRALLSQAATGSLVDVVCAGDSRTAGWSLGGSQNSWPSQLRARLEAAGVPTAGTGLVMVANGGSGFTDTRLVYAGTWTANPPNRTWGASGSTATFTSDAAGTVAEVYYALGSGTFTVSIDGAAAVTVTPASGSGVAKYTVTGLANTTHTVRVTTTSTAGNLIGFCVRATTGLLLHSVACGGWTSTQWTATGTGTLQAITNFINPAAFGLMIGINDQNQSIAASTVAANLATILATNNGAREKFLLTQTPAPAATLPWPPYISALYDQADNLSLPLLDINDRFGAPAQATTAGLLGTDSVHETAAGANDIARGVAGMLAA